MSALKVRRMFHLGLVDRDMRHPCRVRGIMVVGASRGCTPGWYASPFQGYIYIVQP